MPTNVEPEEISPNQQDNLPQQQQEVFHELDKEEAEAEEALRKKEESE